MNPHYGLYAASPMRHGWTSYCRSVEFSPSNGRFMLAQPTTPNLYRTMYPIRPTSLTNRYIGGTNLRVCLVSLEGEGKFEITQAKYRLSEEQKQDDGQKLFDFCAECLKAFVESHKEEGLIPKDQTIPLGFTVCSTPPYEWPY